MIEKVALRREESVLIRSIIESLAKQRRVKRWRLEDDDIPLRDITDTGEYNSEHLGGMYQVATAILTLAEVIGDEKTAALNDRKINRLIAIHDLEESMEDENGQVLGDISGVKDELYYEREQQARENIKKKLLKSNTLLGRIMVADVDDYFTKESPESHFVKAIDEIQAWLFLAATDSHMRSSRKNINPNTNKAYTYAQEFPTLQGIMEKVMRFTRAKFYAVKNNK